MAGRDRISNLPPDILDKIVGYLPVVEAARLAVLSSIFRDTWFNLKQLKFDYDFDAHIQMKYPEENPEFTWDTGGFNIANKVLIQHRGPIHNFLLHFLGVHSKVPIAVLFSFLDQWFLILTQKGVEEMEFQIYSAHMFKLPNCTYTCSTLKILRLSGVIVKPINTRFIFPNVTSLVFECVYFYDENLSDCGVNVPMLENLSFEKCTNMSCFNITAPRLQSLSVTDGRNNKLGSFLPVNLDFKSISTLSLNDNCLKELLQLDSHLISKDFVIQVTGRGEQVQPATLNVEHMNLSGFRPSSSSSFACLLQIYFQPHGHPPLCLPELKLLEELDAVAQTCKLLHVLKFCFNGLGPEMHFIKTLLASFPTLEKVFIVRYKQYGNKFTMKEEFKIMSELLRFPRASKKAEIVYTSCNNHMCVECN